MAEDDLSECDPPSSDDAALPGEDDFPPPLPGDEDFPPPDGDDFEPPQG